MWWNSRMRIAAAGILNRGEVGTERAIATFPAVTALLNRRLIASYRIGSTKDSADETVELRFSQDLGETWTEPIRPFSTTVEGVSGSLRVVYITELDDRLAAAGLWVDRSSYPGKPLFNPATQGGLPMMVVLADSVDGGQTWTAWRTVRVPPDLGPPSLTSPLLKLPGGRLALSIESNKNYDDARPWVQFVTWLISSDGGTIWDERKRVCGDPSGRYFHWDQRAAVAPNGRAYAFTWMYDSVAERYLDIVRFVSCDSGSTWTTGESLGIRDQPSHPAILPDGRTVLARVDRFVTRSIRARLAESPEGSFSAESEVVLYEAPGGRAGAGSTGETLADMGLWTYGLPYAEALPSGEALIVWYSGDSQTMDILW